MTTTAADILGLNRKAKIPSRWLKHYQELCAERDRLRQRDLSAAEASTVKLDDISDAAADESQRGLSYVTGSATQDIIFEVVAAIQRIEGGTYGICELTGEPIEAERLRAIPWARYSFAGQHQVERSESLRRIALPSLELLNGADAEVEERESEGQGPAA